MLYLCFVLISRWYFPLSPPSYHPASIHFPCSFTAVTIPPTPAVSTSTSSASPARPSVRRARATRQGRPPALPWRRRTVTRQTGTGSRCSSSQARGGSTHPGRGRTRPRGLMSSGTLEGEAQHHCVRDYIWCTTQYPVYPYTPGYRHIHIICPRLQSARCACSLYMW